MISTTGPAIEPAPGQGKSGTPGGCPRRARAEGSAATGATAGWVSVSGLSSEPFRVFFPLATLAGLVGVALWPAMLLGWTESYPGPGHARLMVQGFFAGFILGFLGTSIPRLVEARPFSAPETFGLLALFAANLAANLGNRITLADGLFAAELLLFLGLLKRRCHSGRDRPPPGFGLAGLALLSGVAGSGLHLAARHWHLGDALELLARLLGWHAFVLLCVLGAGGFLLPRFLGLGARRTYPESAEPTPEWQRASRVAWAAGIALLLTFALEAAGWNRTAGSLRAVIVVAYLAYEMPLERLRWSWQGVDWQLFVGLACVPIGILLAGWWMVMRATLLHVVLVGGFALITTAVAARVVFGHSGARDKAARFHLGLTLGGALMVIGLATRLSGDFLPGIQATHYIYGAAFWMAGLLFWGCSVLPRVLKPDPEA